MSDAHLAEAIIQACTRAPLMLRTMADDMRLPTGPMATLARQIADDIDQLLTQATNADRTSAEALGFCKDCPDHEACATGWPCWRVKELDRAADRLLNNHPTQEEPTMFGAGSSTPKVQIPQGRSMPNGTVSFKTADQIKKSPKK